MIRLIDLLKGVFLCLLFTVILRAIEIYIESEKSTHRNFNKTRQVKIKIMLVSISMIALVGIVYEYECRNRNEGPISIL